MLSFLLVKMISVALFIVVILSIAIWLIIELKRFRHKIFAIFLIALILFVYITAKVAFKNYEIDYKTVPGVIKATQVYFSWLVSVFGNFKSITSNAIRMDWGGNQTKIK